MRHTVTKEQILEAKEVLGDRNADIIAELLDIERYDEVKKIGCCPSPDHDDSTPSCSYNPVTHSFYCFGCGATYDILTAYMLKYGDTFIDACERLFNEAKLPFNNNEKGMRERGYQYPKPKYADNKDNVYKYWATRGISKETIDYLDIREDTAGNTLFQYYDLNDVLVMVKVRKSRKVKKGETKIYHLKDADKTDILYNINQINTTQPLIIVGGEGDCATLIECGMYNTVSTNGGDQNLHWIGECWEWLNQFDEIVIVPDNDDAGKKFATEAATRLGEYRCKIAQVPRFYEDKNGNKISIKDLNELLYCKGKQAVRDVILDADNSEIPSIIDYTDVKKFDMSEVEGFKTGFKELDSAIDKFYMGTTTIITGSAGSGKSSFISSLVCRSVQQGFPCFVYSGELSNPSLKNWIDSVHAGQRGLFKTNDGYYKIKPEVYKKINSYYKGQLYFYKDSYEHKFTRLLSTMESVVRKLGVKTIVLDNMSSVDLENNDSNKYQKQDEFIRNVIEFSKRWQVAVVLVIHPRKLDEVRRMGLFDLQGVVSAVNLAHRVLAIYKVTPKDREGQQNYQKNGWKVKPLNGDVVVDVLKDRFGSGANKSVELYYDFPSRRFFDTLECLSWQYDWDKTDYGGAELPFPPKQLEQQEEYDDSEVFGF